MKSATIRFGLVALCASVTSVSAFGQTINFTLFSSSYNFDSFNSFTRDESTGKYYYRESYAGGTTVFVYNTEAQLASNSPVSTTTLAVGGFYGTYDSVVNGKLYGRTDNTTTAIGRWDASTGAQDETVASVANMGGANGTDTFNWGGYSGMNFFNDGSGIYLFGHNPSGNWTLDHMSADLHTVLGSQSVASSGIGYAFDINGHLFLSSVYNTTSVSSRFDIGASSQQAVSFSLAGMGADGNVYLSDMFYDSLSDSLFAWNTQTQQLFVTRNAAAQFGVVPEPASLGVLALGALALLKRKRR